MHGQVFVMMHYVAQTRVDGIISQHNHNDKIAKTQCVMNACIIDMQSTFCFDGL